MWRGMDMAFRVGHGCVVWCAGTDVASAEEIGAFKGRGERWGRESVQQA